MTTQDSVSFEDKLALVSGASRGIGRRVALELATRGAKVIAVARSQADLVSLDDQLKQKNHQNKIIIAPLDITDHKSIEGLFGGIYQRFGRLDILCSCAAILGNLSPIIHHDSQEIKDLLETNLIANHQLIRFSHPLLLKSPHPRATFISCSLGKDKPFWGIYSMSKLALESMIMSYARENLYDNARINIVRAKPTLTDLYLQAYPGHKHSDSDSLKPPSYESVYPILETLSLQETRHGCIIEGN